MHPFQEGNLLIGGMRLSHIHGELEQEDHEEDALDWDFSGRIVFTSEECQALECSRRYRLELADGRAGLVILCSLETKEDSLVIAEFLPQKKLIPR
jgi:hypothetical protein